MQTNNKKTSWLADCIVNNPPPAPPHPSLPVLVYEMDRSCVSFRVGFAASGVEFVAGVDCELLSRFLEADSSLQATLLKILSF